MIKGIGLDIVEIRRIDRSLNRGTRLADRILTAKERKKFDELASPRRQAEYLAGRFAAKEAMAKAAGKGIGRLSFQHIETSSTEDGAPVLHVRGYEQNQLFVSITHSMDYAAAQVIIEE
ncbi:holo-ACP synthase [Virgibacillus xinjiangensis]|uniref:Holo-[acyl-carrier-protein] synthase n=1 Tax=Virgibacillus xinjiangensis TaxID=393090 RepID=A0ABV7CSR1_9BACI